MSKITNLTGGAVKIAVAATKKGGGWDHFYLDSAQNTDNLTDDPDGFACYDSATGLIVKAAYQGIIRTVWRLHDFTTVEIKQNEGGHIEAFTSFGSFKLCGYYGGFPKCHLLELVDLEPFHYEFPRSL